MMKEKDKLLTLAKEYADDYEIESEHFGELKKSDKDSLYQEITKMQQKNEAYKQQVKSRRITQGTVGQIGNIGVTGTQSWGGNKMDEEPHVPRNIELLETLLKTQMILLKEINELKAQVEELSEKVECT